MIIIDQSTPTDSTIDAQNKWATDAAGWRKSHGFLESEGGGKRLSARLVELSGIGPGDSVLDVAGGYGEPSLTAARVVGPDGHVICNDISGDMLAFGRERAAVAGLENIEFFERDAEQLEFDPESFDAVLSRSGLMFLSDVQGTLKKFHAFLKPGGRLAASVWGPPPTVQMLAAMPVVFEQLNIAPPPMDGPGTFALADAGKLGDLVDGAGFRDVETGTLTVTYEADSPEEFTVIIWSLAPAMITDLVNAQSPETRQCVLDRVIEAYARFQQPDGRVRTENQAIWVSGTK